jgi:DHA2 family multidrug resistance protein-like MFS transporter
MVNWIYRGAVAGALGSELPPNALAAARDTLGGALSVAGGLPEPVGVALVSASRSVFVDAFQATALVSAVITFIAAGAVALIFSRPHQSPGVPTTSSEVSS